MERTVVQRAFEYNQLKLEDPDPTMPLEDVRNFYAGIYPELTQAVTEGPHLEDGKQVYKFRRTVGTKGTSVTELAAYLKRKEEKGTARLPEERFLLSHSIESIIDRDGDEAEALLPPSHLLGMI